MEWQGKYFFFNHFPSNCCQTFLKYCLKKVIGIEPSPLQMPCAKRKVIYTRFHCAFIPCSPAKYSTKPEGTGGNASSILYSICHLGRRTKQKHCKRSKMARKITCSLTNMICTSDQETNTCIQINMFSVIYVSESEMKVAQL